MAPASRRAISKQRVEGLDQLVGLLNRALEAFAPGRTAALIGERRLGPVAQPIERRLEIVRDVVGDLAQAGHQLLDALEHGVELAGKPIELVVGAVARNAARRDRPP